MLLRLHSGKDELTIWDRHHPKGWIAQKGERWYSHPEVSGSSPGPVKVFFAIFRDFHLNLIEIPEEYHIQRSHITLYLPLTMTLKVHVARAPELAVNV